MSSLIGSSFGDYQILTEMGRGGMAIVYKAYEPSLRRYVALKVLPPQFTFDTNFVQRFMHEARTAAALTHPNIITIYKVGEFNGTYYFAMQLIEGGTLQQLIRREGALSTPRVVYMVQQLASALDYAHRQGLIHRDIKPANVMIGEQDHITLMDFGIARAAEGSKLTQAGMVVGTPEYMSPEQAQGEEIDRRSDIYSLGVVIYEMFTGRVPFTGTTPHSVLHKHVYETPPPLRSLARGVPRDVEKVVSQALAKDPKKRYQSAGELAYALSKACGVKALTPAPLPPVLTAVLQRAPQPEKATASMAAVAGTAEPTPGVVGAETVEAGQLAPPPKVPTAVPEARKGSPVGYVVLGIVGLAVLAALMVFLNRGKGGPPDTATPTASVTRTATRVVTLTPARTRTRTPTSTPTMRFSATPTLKPTSTRTRTATRSPTVRPTATPVPIHRPVLLSPVNGAGVAGGTVNLDWDWPRALGTNEHFDVRAWQEGQPHNGVAWVEDSKFLWQPPFSGRWYWSVAVIRQTGIKPDGSKEWSPVSEESEVRWFEYSGSPPVITEPTKPPPPVEPTKPPPPDVIPNVIPSPEGAKPSSD